MSLERCVCKELNKQIRPQIFHIEVAANKESTSLCPQSRDKAQPPAANKQSNVQRPMATIDKKIKQQQALSLPQTEGMEMQALRKR